MFNTWFSNRKKEPIPVFTDIHSHLLPGIDDGVKTMEESLETISQLRSLGFKKLITTPHIMSDYYKNTPEIIKSKLSELKIALKSANIQVEIEAAAEYYLDENFYKKIIENEELLTFGDNYILFETSFNVEPLILKEAIFRLNSSGYKPVFAHPERYQYLHENKKLLNELIDQGLLFQINALSLTGYYSKQVQKFAEALIKRSVVAFIGSDCHNMLQAEMLKSAYSSNLANKIDVTKLLNHTL